MAAHACVRPPCVSSAMRASRATHLPQKRVFTSFFKKKSLFFLFFFEKKNQKTFVSVEACRPSGAARPPAMVLTLPRARIDRWKRS